jgi:hypothetical protein
MSLRGSQKDSTSFLDDRELWFITGKGGVGKTTVALATAMAPAAAGGASWCASWPGRRGPRRSSALTPARPGTSSSAAFVSAAPGARELVAMTKAWELGRGRRWVNGRGRYDLVVVDGPASRHGIGLLRTPRTFAEIARFGPIASQARKVDALLEDPERSAVVALALPSELSVSETVELEARVAAGLGRPLDAVMVNGVLPRRFSAEEIERLMPAMARWRRRSWRRRAGNTARAAPSRLSSPARAATRRRRSRRCRSWRRPGWPSTTCVPWRGGSDAAAHQRYRVGSAVSTAAPSSRRSIR